MSEKNIKAIKTVIAEYFATNIKEKEVNITTDGFLFPQRKHALDHASTLDESQREVKTIQNPLYSKESIKEKKKSGDGLSEDEKKLLDMELSNKNYVEMKGLIKALEIETPDQKAETLIEALEGYKQKINK
ncbi:hypothetical protein V3468_02815 [Flavobacterium oreochromis]|uniref:hypothetical protein n=1 Tax=Flavobacterium oreochromis TaxID=2906078 RepID=UPI003859DA62